MWGNLYLTEKQGGEEFTEADQEAAVILAEWAGAAIEKALRDERSEHQREACEWAALELQATRDVALAAGAATGLGRVLELVAKRGRALIDAQSTLVMLRDGSELVVAASRTRGPSARPAGAGLEALWGSPWMIVGELCAWSRAGSTRSSFASRSRLG